MLTRSIGLAAVIGLILLRPVPAAAELPQANFLCGAEVSSSVRLASDVSTFGTGCNGDGLRITKSGITLDLGRHTIYGDRENDAGTPDIGIALVNVKNVTIKNGTVRGFVDGIRSNGLSGGSVFKGLVVADSIDDGIEISGAGIVASKNVVVGSGDRGITLHNPAGRVISNVVGDSGADGIHLIQSRDATVSNNVVSGSDAVGMALNQVKGSTVTGNTVANNDVGMTVSERAFVRSNTAVHNANGGISVTGPRAKVVSNRAVDNGDQGLLLTMDGGIARSNVTSANGGQGLIVVGDRNVVGGNRSDGNAVFGIQSNGEEQRVVGNRTTGNGATGIRIASGTGKVDGNVSVGNGFGNIDGGLGIEAPGSSFTGKNVATANEDSDGCSPTSLCKPHGTDSPPSTKSCGALVASSIRLTQDVGSSITPCGLHGLIVARDGITIDLGGRTIWGDDVNDDNAVSEAGIVVGGFRDVRIVNGTIHGFEHGVDAGDSIDLVVGDMEIRDATSRGLTDGAQSVRPTVVRSTFIGNNHSGLFLNAAKALVDTVVARSNGTGMIVSRDSRIRRSVGVRNDSSGIVLGCCEDGATIVSDSTADANGQDGITAAWTHQRIVDSVATDNGAANPHAAGMRGSTALFNNAADAVLIRNISTDSEGAGYDFSGQRTRFQGNLAVNNDGAGIEVLGRFSAVENNIALGEREGIRVERGDSTIVGNLVADNSFGVLAEGDRLAIKRNLAFANGLAGISVRGRDVVVSGNRALGNGYNSVDGVGRGLTESGDVLGNNVAYGNDDPDECDPDPDPLC